MTDKFKLDRRDFLRHAAGAVGASTQIAQWPALEMPQSEDAKGSQAAAHEAEHDIHYPRQFRGRQLKMISFPLGGVAAGSIGLGGRGQLCNWEIFNRPNKGYRPSYAFASIWAQSGNQKPVARVLESRILPPYEGQDGLGSDNAPGVSRLESAVFTGGYPLAHIDFEDRSLPVKVELDAFSPFIPHEPDDSGLPVAILRYRVTNTGHVPAKVSIAYSLDNPVKTSDRNNDKRVNTYRSVDGLAGLLMNNPGLVAEDPMSGTFALAAIPESGIEVSYWIGWPKGRWWNSPLLFWDQFSKEGTLGAQPESPNSVGVLCLHRTIRAGESASFPFLLGWHFPRPMIRIRLTALSPMRFRLPFFVLILLTTASYSIIAQEAPTPDASPVSNAPDTTNQPEDRPAATLRVNVNLVSLYFTVHDKRGALIPHLTKDDCGILEDKAPQKIKNFSAETDLPLTLGILLDTSGSQQYVLPMEQQTGSAFLKRILRSKDEAFLVSFDVQISLLQDFTSNARQLERAMNEAEINTGGGGGGVPGIGQGPVPVQGTPKGTLLYDAVYQVANDKLRSETGRKAIILLTDGEDQGSHYKIADAIEAAQKANLIIYVLLIADRGFYSNYGYGINIGYTGASAMKKMADETGGRMIDVGNNGKKMEAAFQQIEDELRTQYLASYTPTNNKLDGSYRKLDVSCKGDGLKVQTRKGYYAIGSPDEGAGQ